MIEQIAINFIVAVSIVYNIFYTEIGFYLFHGASYALGYREEFEESRDVYFINKGGAANFIWSLITCMECLGSYVALIFATLYYLIFGGDIFVPIISYISFPILFDAYLSYFQKE